MKQKISSQDAPAAIGPYSQAVLSGNLLFISGQLPVNAKTNRLISGGIAAQTLQALDNLAALLKAAKATLDDVVQITLYLADLNDFGEVNAAYATRFTSSIQPSRVTVQVARLPLDSPLEISCIAIVPQGQGERLKLAPS